MTSQHRLFLDTDIASDVDDAMALAVILGSPETQLVGISTVYGDTLLRARVAARYGRLAGRSLDVHPGLGSPRSGREVWWAGIEGSLHDDLDGEEVDGRGGVDRLVEVAQEAAGELDIVAIGPLTNLAAALDADPAFERNVRRLYVMGGAFFGGPGPDGTGIEHNFRSDADAAARVFDSRIPTTVTSLDFTETVHFEPADLERITGAGVLGQALAADIRQWWTYWSQEWNAPHDPLTALTALAPGLFRLSTPGRVRIDTSAENAGRSTFVPDADGTVLLVESADVAAVRSELLRRIAVAGAAAATNDGHPWLLPGAR